VASASLWQIPNVSIARPRTPPSRQQLALLQNVAEVLPVLRVVLVVRLRKAKEEPRFAALGIPTLVLANVTSHIGLAHHTSPVLVVDLAVGILDEQKM